MAARTKKESKVSRVPRVSKESKKGISVPSYSLAGVKSTTNLPEAVFGQKINKPLIAQAVRVFLSNQRKAHAKTKTRAEVVHTTAKIYRQKGTGGARHGDRGAPIFVGGGIAHGPRGIQNYKLSLSKVLKKKVLVSVLSSQVAQGRIIIGDLEKIGEKTKKLAQVLKKMNILKPAVLVYSNSRELVRAARNIEGLSLVPAKDLTAYQVLKGKQIVFTKEAIDVVEKRLAGGKN